MYHLFKKMTYDVQIRHQDPLELWNIFRFPFSKNFSLQEIDHEVVEGVNGPTLTWKSQMSLAAERWAMAWVKPPGLSRDIKRDVKPLLLGFLRFGKIWKVDHIFVSTFMAISVAEREEK